MNPSDLSPSVHELTAIKSGDQAAFADLLSRWMPNIRVLARGFAPNQFDRDDYVQIGSLTLFQVCVDTADATEKAFVRYTRRAVRLAMIDLRRATRGKSRSVVAFASPDELPETAAAGPEPVEALMAAERRQVVRTWWNQAEGRTRTLLDRLYGAGLWQAELARELGITPTRVGQLHNELIGLARGALALLN